MTTITTFYLSNWSSDCEVLHEGSALMFIKNPDSMRIDGLYDIRVSNDNVEFSMHRANRHLEWLERLADRDSEDYNGLGFLADILVDGLQEYHQGEVRAVVLEYFNDDHYKFRFEVPKGLKYWDRTEDEFMGC